MKTITCDLCESGENVIEDFRISEDICTGCIQKMYAAAPNALNPDNLVWLHTKGLHAIEPEIFDKLIEEMDTYLLRSEIVDALKQVYCEDRVVIAVRDKFHPDYRTEFFREVTSNENL